VTRPDDSTESLAGRSAKEHAGSKNSLRERAALHGKRAGNHGLCGRGVSGFPQTDHSSSDEEEQKTGHQTAGERSRAPEKDAKGYDRFAAETIREKTKRYATGGENHEEKSLQRAELGVRGVKMIA